jgi:hypothetical protein
VTRPLTNSEEYDVDLVCLLKASKTEFTQKSLKEAVGAEVALYAEARNMTKPLEEGRRCWTLNYADGAQFHMDILPALPDAQRYQTMLMEKGCRVLASDAASPGTLSPLPTRPCRNMGRLRMTGRRAIRWATPPGSGTGCASSSPSARRPSASVRASPRASTTYPVNPAENFADKWAEEPKKRKNFDRWLSQARSDFALYLRASPFSEMPALLREHLGADFVDRMLAAMLPTVAAGLASPAIAASTSNSSDMQRAERAIDQIHRAGPQSKPWAGS